MVQGWEPTALEIVQRCCQLHWMKGMGFPDRLVDSIMRDSMPEIAAVRKMVETYGPAETKRRLERFLFGGLSDDDRRS